MENNPFPRHGNIHTDQLWESTQAYLSDAVD